MQKYFGEIIADILAEVRTSPPPLPDFSEVSVRKRESAHQVRASQLQPLRQVFGAGFQNVQRFVGGCPRK